MSDPEDLQSDRKSGGDEWIYQLKRIGPPATCPKVPDIMKLNLGLTKIGRGQQNDFYLDSAVLKNFISRSHVEIFGKKNENGEVEYIVTDKGLNGTFINDIRTHKTCSMEVGDKVTFGHTNGYKIQPGSYAEQPSSEFQFMFERVPKIHKTSEILSEGLTVTEIPDEESRAETTDLKTESTIVTDRLFLSDIQSNVQSQEKSSKSRTSQKSRSRKDSSEHSDLELPSCKNSSHTKSNKVTKKRNSDSSNKSLSVETSSSRRKGSASSARDRFSETLAAQDNVDDDEDDENNENNENKDNNDSEDEVDEVEEEDNEDNKDNKDIKDNNDSEDEVEEEEEVEEVEEVKPKVDLRRKKVQRKVSTQKKAPAKRKVTVPSDSEESSEEDEASKPEADQKPKAPSHSSMRQKQIKKKKSGNDAPAIGSRKRRRKAAATGQSTATTSDDLEPGVEWYEDDRCEAPDCKRPKKKRTPWVQCDDCDSWYHTVCVGANYKRLKDSDEHFNCGCE